MKLTIGLPREPSGEIRLAEEVEAYNEALKVRVQDALDKYAEILLDELADLTPKDTGETALSWEVFHAGVWELFITNSNEPVSTFLSEGTAAHWVEPVVAAAVHWTIGGVDFFSKGHMVSGISPHFIEWNALENTKEDLNALLDDAESQAFEDAFERDVGVSSPKTAGDGGDLGGPDSEGEDLEGGMEEGIEGEMES